MIKIDIHDLPNGARSGSLESEGTLRTIMEEFGYMLALMHSRCAGADPKMARAFQEMWRVMVAEDSFVWRWKPKAGEIDMLMFHGPRPHKEDKP